ncbi:MAG: hypothetical protein NW226_08655 [Microscillaceae bacterium]|nr:hypothetical protein [Microscillaceae bacterium]
MAHSGKPGAFQRLKKALSIYWKMNAEEKKIIRTRTIDGAHSPDYWINFIDEAAEFDHYADSVRYYFSTFGGIVLGISLFVSIFLFAFGSENRSTFMISLALFFVALAFVVGGGALMIYFYLKSKDIGNQLRLFVVPLISLLKEEVPETELIHLKTNLRRKDRKDNEVHREKNYKPSFFSRYGWIILLVIIAFFILAVALNNENLIPIAFIMFFVSVFGFIIASMFGKYPKILTTLHQHPWLDLTARLNDGSRLRITIKDDIARYRITRKKRGSSGKTKIKTKTKYKIRTNFWVTLALQNKRYEVGNVGSELRNALGIKMKHRPSERRNSLKVNFRWKTKDIQAVPDFQTFLGLIAGAYKKAEPVQKQP